MSLLEVSGLSIRYGGVEALRELDLTVDPGQIVVVLGANGAGKTSTVSGICGIVKKAAGTVMFDGVDISRLPAHRVARSGLVLVPEGRRIFAPLSVEENLLLGEFANRQRRNTAETLELVYTKFPILKERRRGRAGLLSGGEQQMLAFGRALMARPRLVIMDEPSMGLSPVMVDSIMDSISEMSSDVAVLMVEQNAAAAFEIATDVLVLDRGVVGISGSAVELKSHPDVMRAFLGELAVEAIENEVAHELGANSAS